MKNLLTLCALLVFGGLGFNSLNAQDITGDWEGNLEVQGMKLKIIFHVNKEGDGYSATMDSPDQGQKDIPMDKATFEGGELIIGLSQAGMEYNAKPDGDFTSLEGTWKQMGMNLPLKMVRSGTMKEETAAAIKSENADKVSGDWNGILKVQGMELPLIIHVTAEGDVLSATMDSPNQGANGIPVKEVFFKDGSFEFKIPAMGISYAGKPDADFQNIEGKFSQMGQNLDLTLSKKK